MAGTILIPQTAHPYNRTILSQIAVISPNGSWTVIPAGCYLDQIYVVQEYL